MAKPGTVSGAIEHKFRGKRQIHLNKESREYAQLLAQEAIIRRDFGEEGVERFWKEVERRAMSEDSQCQLT